MWFYKKKPLSSFDYLVSLKRRSFLISPNYPFKKNQYFEIQILFLTFDLFFLQIVPKGSRNLKMKLWHHFLHFLVCFCSKWISDFQNKINSNIKLDFIIQQFSKQKLFLTWNCRSFILFNDYWYDQQHMTHTALILLDIF